MKASENNLSFSFKKLWSLVKTKGYMRASRINNLVIFFVYWGMIMVIGLLPIGWWFYGENDSKVHAFDVNSFVNALDRVSSSDISLPSFANSLTDQSRGLVPAGGHGFLAVEEIGGELVAVGYNRVYRWDNGSWTVVNSVDGPIQYSAGGDGVFNETSFKSVKFKDSIYFIVRGGGGLFLNRIYKDGQIRKNSYTLGSELVSGHAVFFDIAVSQNANGSLLGLVYETGNNQTRFAFVRDGLNVNTCLDLTDVHHIFPLYGGSGSVFYFGVVIDINRTQGGGTMHVVEVNTNVNTNTCTFHKKEPDATTINDGIRLGDRRQVAIYDAKIVKSMDKATGLFVRYAQDVDNSRRLYMKVMWVQLDFEGPENQKKPIVKKVANYFPRHDGILVRNPDGSHSYDGPRGVLAVKRGSEKAYIVEPGSIVEIEINNTTYALLFSYISCEGNVSGLAEGVHPRACVGGASKEFYIEYNIKGNNWGNWGMYFRNSDSSSPFHTGLMSYSTKLRKLIFGSKVSYQPANGIFSSFSTYNLKGIWMSGELPITPPPTAPPTNPPTNPPTDPTPTPTPTIQSNCTVTATSRSGYLELESDVSLAVNGYSSRGMNDTDFIIKLKREGYSNVIEMPIKPTVITWSPSSDPNPKSFIFGHTISLSDVDFYTRNPNDGTAPKGFLDLRNPRSDYQVQVVVEAYPIRGSALLFSCSTNMTVRPYERPKVERVGYKCKTTNNPYQMIFSFRAYPSLSPGAKVNDIFVVLNKKDNFTPDFTYNFDSRLFFFNPNSSDLTGVIYGRAYNINGISSDGNFVFATNNDFVSLSMNLIPDNSGRYINVVITLNFKPDLQNFSNIEVIDSYLESGIAYSIGVGDTSYRMNLITVTERGSASNLAPPSGMIRGSGYRGQIGLNAYQECNQSGIQITTNAGDVGAYKNGGMNYGRVLHDPANSNHMPADLREGRMWVTDYVYEAVVSQGGEVCSQGVKTSDEIRGQFCLNSASRNNNWFSNIVNQIKAATPNQYMVEYDAISNRIDLERIGITSNTRLFIIKGRNQNIILRDNLLVDSLKQPLFIICENCASLTVDQVFSSNWVSDEVQGDRRPPSRYHLHIGSKDIPKRIYISAGDILLGSEDSIQKRKMPYFGAFISAGVIYTARTYTTTWVYGLVYAKHVVARAKPNLQNLDPSGVSNASISFRHFGESDSMPLIHIRYDPWYKIWFDSVVIMPDDRNKTILGL